MVTRLYFSQDFSGFFKNGQKKCPKLKIPKYFWEKNNKNNKQSSLSYFGNLLFNSLSLKNIIKL
jgi:chloramphenicol O-acetyltransferase